MKKVLIITAALLFVSGALFADKRVESKAFNGEPAVGTIKVGLMGGYPSGITAGFRPSDTLEFNATVGTSYLDFTIGANMLFTIVDVNIEGHIFPLSVGPAVNINIPLNTYLSRTLSIDAMGAVRWEYTFTEFPINLFAEIALGVKFGGYNAIGFGWNSAAGVRYVF